MSGPGARERRSRFVSYDPPAKGGSAYALARTKQEAKVPRNIMLRPVAEPRMVNIKAGEEPE